MGAQALGAVVAWPMVGRAMDLRGRRMVILCGVALFLGVTGLYLSIDAIGPFVYAVRVLDGVATAMWYSALFTYAADLVPPQRRTEGLAIFGVSGLISIALGAQSGDVVLTYATYRELFIIAFILVALGSCLCLLLRDRSTVSDHEHPPARSVLVTAAQRNLVSVWLAAFAFFVGVATLFSFMKTFMATTATGRVGNFFMAYAGIAVALRVFAGWLPDRVGLRRLLGIAMFWYAAGLVVLSTGGTAAAVVIAGLLCGAGHGYTFPVLFSLVVERARPQERGAAAAFFTTLDWLALLVAGPVVGYVIERTGYSRAFVGLAAFLAIGIVIFYLLDHRGMASSDESGTAHDLSR
jgi:predicted MFS family arabinose efflux permease